MFPMASSIIMDNSLHVIENQDLSTLFGIELDTPSSPSSKIKLKANTEAKSGGVSKKKNNKNLNKIKRT